MGSDLFSCKSFNLDEEIKNPSSPQRKPYQGSNLLKSNTSISEEICIQKDFCIKELNKKKEQILGNITKPKISNSIIKQNRGPNSLFGKTKEVETRKSDLTSNSSTPVHHKVSKKALNTIRDIEKSSPLSSSYFKQKLDTKITPMSNSEFKSKINFIY